MNGISERFHGQRSLFKAGQIKEVGDRTQANHHVIVWKLVMMMIKSVRNRHQLPLKIDALNFAGKKVNPLQELSYRIHDVLEIKIAGRYFVQHRSEQKEIVTI